MSHGLDGPSTQPSHPSYASSNASTLTRLAHLLQKDVRRTSADAHTSFATSAGTGTRSGQHSRTQSDDSDWLAGRYNGVFARPGSGRAGRGSGGAGGEYRPGSGGRGVHGDLSGGSSGEDLSGESTIRGRPDTRARGASASAAHPYATAPASSYNYSRPAPGTPIRAPQLRVQPPTPSQVQIDRAQEQHRAQQTTPPSRSGPSFYALDSGAAIGESPKPSPLKPSKSAAAVARFRAAAAKHDHTRYGSTSAEAGAVERDERVVPFYSTNTRARAALPASTLSVITSTAALEAAGLPPTPPLQGDFGTATVYPPVRLSGAPPLSPPQEPVRLSGQMAQHPYASGGYELSPRRVRSQGSMLAAFDKPVTPPKSPSKPGFERQQQQGYTAPPSYSAHPYGSFSNARQPSATTALAATSLSVPPLRVPQLSEQSRTQQQNSGHPFADPAFRRQRLDSGPDAGENPFSSWTGRNRSQTNIDLSRPLPPPVPTHWRHQPLRGSASAYDLRSPTSPRTRDGVGLGFPTQPSGNATLSASPNHWHLFPRRLTGSKSHGRLKPSTSTFATSNGAHTGAGETNVSGRTDTSHVSLQVRTACDALVFPRPRLRPHEISPPDSPNESPLFTPGEWARTQRQKNHLAETDPVPPQPRSAFLQRVLAEGQQRERERIEWAAAAERGQIFGRRRAKSMPRSRYRAGRTNGDISKSQSHSHLDLGLGRPSMSSSRGAISDSEDSHGHWWNKKKQNSESHLGRNGSIGSRLLRKGSNVSMLGRERQRTESMPASVDPHARTVATAVANGAMVTRGDSLLRQRNAAAALNGHVNGHTNGHPQVTRMEPRNPRTLRTFDDLPLVDIRPGAVQEPVSERSQPKAETRTRATTAPTQNQQPTTQKPQQRAAVSNPLIHPHIPHPYAAAFGAAQRSPSNAVGRGKDIPQPAHPLTIMPDPHPADPAHPHHLIEEEVAPDMAMRHRMPPRPAQHGSPQTGEQKKRSPRVPVPSYYSPELPPVLQQALEASDDGREFLASIDGDHADDDEEEDHGSRASTPRPGEKRQGYHWDPSTDRALLIAAGLNPSPSPDTGAEFFSDARHSTGKDIVAPPLSAKILAATASRTTLEDESGFVTASEGRFGESREELQDTLRTQTTEDLPEIPSLPGSNVHLPGAFYAQSTAYRSANTLASSMLLGASPNIPYSPASPPLPVATSPHSLPAPSGEDTSPSSEKRPFPSRGSSGTGEAVPRTSPHSARSPRRTFSYGSRSSSDVLEPPAPLGGLDQIEAQMFKDLYWTPAEDVDQATMEEQVQAELSDARALREQERREREEHLTTDASEHDEEELPSIEVEQSASDPETEEEDARVHRIQRMPEFNTPPERHGESESDQFLTPAGSRSRRPSSERAETPMSAYNAEFPHDDEIRVGQVGEMPVPPPTTTQIKHLSLPLSVIDSEGALTDLASTLDPSSPPPGQRIISLSASTAGHLSLPSSAFASDGGGGRGSHLTGVSLGTSTGGTGTSLGGGRMSGLLSDFPQPPYEYADPHDAEEEARDYATARDTYTGRHRQPQGLEHEQQQHQQQHGHNQEEDRNQQPSAASSYTQSSYMEYYTPAESLESLGQPFQLHNSHTRPAASDADEDDEGEETDVDGMGMDEFPLELRFGESPTVRLATLRAGEVGSPGSPGTWAERRLG